MIRSVVCWLIWFIAVAALVFFLNAAEKAGKKGDLLSPRGISKEYHWYMD